MAFKSILFLILNVFTLCLTSSIPVITWWHGTGLNVPSQTSHVLSGHTLKLPEVLKKVKPVCEKSNVVVMLLQDELSVDDFTKYPDAFPFLQQQLEKAKHFVFPSVSREKGTLYESLRGNSNYNVVEVFPETDWTSQLSKENLENGKVNVFVLHLEPVTDVDSSLKNVIFKRNDATTNTVVEKVLKMVPDIAFIYTASEPSKDIAKVIMDEQIEDDHSLNSRHLLAEKVNAKEAPQKVYNTSGVMMALSGLEFGDDLTNMENFNASDINATSTINTTLITLAVQKGGVELDIKMDLTRNIEKQQWTCESIHVNGKFNGSSVDVKFECGDNSTDPMRMYTANEMNTITAPFQYSFACHKLMFTFKENKTQYILSMNDVQLQPINGDNQFLDAYNCVGFFSLPILMGLLIGLLLVGSLFLGTMMMMNIQTQDRFDDPKGKTISVHTGE